MKCRQLLRILPAAAAMLVALAAFWSCNESLPAYHFPDHVISAQVTVAEQLSNRVGPPGYQKSHFVLQVQNTFDEPFYDSVDIKGSVRVWWKRKPQRYITLYISEQNLSTPSLITNGKLLMVPNQKITFDFYWDMKSSDSIYLPYEMDYTYATLLRVCDYTVVCSDPEQFVVESSLVLYDKLGYITASPVVYTFMGTECRNCGGGGPYCPPGRGC